MYAVILLIDINFIKSAKKFPRFKIDTFKPFGGKSVYRIYLNEDINKFKKIDNLFERLSICS